MFEFFNQHFAAIYTAGIFINAAVWTAFAVFIFFLQRFELSQIGRWCRGNWVGVILAALGLLWVTPHTQVILNFWSPETAVMIVIAAFFLSIFFLDFLTARAVAGLLIMWVYTAVNANFTFMLPCAAAYDVYSYLIGVLALIVAAKPYLLRDLLDWLGHRAPMWTKVAVAALAAGYAGFSVYLGLAMLGLC